MKEIIEKLRERINDCVVDMGAGWDNFDSVKEAQNTLNKLEEAINYSQCCMGEAEQLLCDCSQGKGADIDEDGFPYCIDCQKNIAK